jgi:outer membrane immunogenic protein
MVAGIGSIESRGIPVKKFLLSVLALTTLSGAQAIAADMPVKARPIPIEVYTWKGCYIGAQGGANWGRSRHDGSPPGPTELTPNFNLRGGEFGVEYGCNYQLSPNWVFGTESDFSFSSKRGSSFDTGPGGNPTFLSTTNEKWFSTTRVRFGYAWDRTLLYVTGGLATASVEAGLNVPGLGSFGETKTLWGGTVGAGIEQALGGGWSVKAEYLYMAFQNKAYTFGDNAILGPFGLNAWRTGLNLSDHVVRIGVNYKFIDCLLFCGPVVARY